MQRKRVSPKPVSWSAVPAGDCFDKNWDAFLLGTPCGQYQQSSLWAEVKKGEDWRPVRWLARTTDGTLLGGFQLLWRPYKRLFRIGYVSKGPVLQVESKAAAAEAVTALTQAIRQVGIHAVIVQPPDDSRQLSQALDRQGFQLNRLWGVIDANLEVDLLSSIEEITRRMRRTTRQEVKQARKRGVTIRVGTRSDLPRFFELMQRSCIRQKTSPNPSSVEYLERFWDVFRPRGLCRLTFADCGGSLVAGLMSIIWGDCLHLWKKGWSEECREGNPNQLLCWEAFEWGKARGLRKADFQAMSRRTADMLLDGRSLDDAAKRSRDLFNLGFGGTPVLLPRAGIYFPSRFLRLAYRLASGAMTR